VIKWRVASGKALQSNHNLEGKLCDFLIERLMGAGYTFIVAELKSRVQHVRSIVKQLQAGADLLAADRGRPPLRAVLVHSGRVGTQEIRLLRSSKIRFHGRQEPIQVIKSGGSLVHC
jgi:hypothetical protein